MEKNWTGTKKSVFKMMGASNHADSERESNDYYATDPKVLELLVRKYELPDVILEPACGSGELSRWLEGVGKKVYSSDIVDRGYGFSDTTIQLDEAAKKFEESLKYLIELGEVEKTIFLLAEEIESTKRRVNALEHIMIPRFENTEKYIDMRLQEMERENFVRLKMIRSTIEKNEKAQAAKEAAE